MCPEDHAAAKPAPHCLHMDSDMKEKQIPRQADLGDTAGLLSDHHNKVNTEAKSQSQEFLGFPMHKKIRFMEFSLWHSGFKIQLQPLGSRQRLGSLPGQARGVKAPVLLQMQRRSQLWLRFNPWPRELPYALSVAITKKKKNVMFTVDSSLLSV